MRRLTVIVTAAAGSGLLLGIFFGFFGRDAPDDIVGNSNVVGAVAGVLALLIAVAALPQRPRTRASISVVEEPLPTPVEQLAAETLKRWTEQVRLRNLTASSALVVRYRVLHSGWTRVSLDESAALTTAEEPTALTEDAVRRLHDELYRPLIGKGGTLVILVKQDPARQVR